jgi:hypothetical protein
LLAVELHQQVLPAGGGDDAEPALQFDPPAASRGHLESHADVGQAYPEIFDHLDSPELVGSADIVLHRRAADAGTAPDLQPMNVSARPGDSMSARTYAC